MRPTSRSARAAPAALATLVGLAAATWGSVAAATPSAKLVYVREPGTSACPAESDLRRAVAARLGYDPFFPSAPKTVIAQISRGTGSYRGRVQIVGDDGDLRGSRDLSTRGDDCSELLSALALAISIALDDLDDGKPPPVPPEVSSSEAAAPAAPAAQPAVATVSPAVPAREIAPSAVVGSSRVGFAASLGPTASLGIAPAPSFGASGTATVDFASLAARVGLRADLPATGNLAGGGTLSTHAVVVSGSACLHGAVPFACLGAGVGSFATTTADIAKPASDTALLVTLLASGGVDIPLGTGLYVEPSFEAGIALARPRVVVDTVESYRVPLLVGSLAIQLGVRFR